MLLLVLCVVCLAFGSSAAVEENTWMAELAPGVDAETWARDNGFVHLAKMDWLGAGFHLFRNRHGLLRTRDTLQPIPDVLLWAERQVLRERVYPRISDPLYEDQWHLHSHPQSIDAEYADGLSGRNVSIAIVDDGLQHTHPDLRANYDAQHSYDYNDNDGDPAPGDARSGHGTAAAGVAAAVMENGHCGRGVAPRASLVGIRAIAAAVTDMTEAQALTHNAVSVVDVYSCSWGPADNGMNMIAPGYVTQTALARYTNGGMGRLGKGTIYVWAAGNGRDAGDSCAYDGYASSPYTMAIGAVDHQGDQAWYSEGCAALFAVAPSSGAMRGITTVDLLGNGGYDPGECTDRFGGTSSAAPTAAGVIALLLERRPELTWRDVRHVVAKGALPIHTDDPDWHLNAGGYRHSHKYGFGALKMVTLLHALHAHVLVPTPALLYRSGVQTVESPHGWIPCNLTLRVESSAIRFIETVALLVALEHSHRGSVTIDLISPAGTLSHMAPARPADDSVNYPSGGWQFVSVRHWGETQLVGEWQLRINDVDQETAGKHHLSGYELRVMGY